MNDSDQSSTGPQSPNVVAGGNVHVEYHGVSPEVHAQLMVKLEILKIDHEAKISTLNRLLGRSGTQSLPELEALIDTYVEHANKILESDEISKEVKALIAKGEIDQAETIVDQRRRNQTSQKEGLAADEYEYAEVKSLNLKYKEAFESYELAAKLQPENSLYLNDAGFTAYTLGEYGKAIEYIKQALASDLKSYGEDHPSVARRRNNLGSAWESKGSYDKAIGYYEQALASDLKTYGEVHPSVARRRNNLGSAWESKGSYDKAIGYYEQALASDLKTYGEDHPNIATMRNNLGGAWKAKGSYDKAIVYYEQALATCEDVLGAGHPNTKIVAENLASVKAAADAEKE